MFRTFGLPILLWLMSAPLCTACTVAMANGSLGVLSSFTVNSAEQQTSANLQVTCDTVLHLLTARDTVSMNVLSVTATSGTRAAMKRTDNATVTDAIPARCAKWSQAAIR